MVWLSEIAGFRRRTPWYVIGVNDFYCYYPDWTTTVEFLIAEFKADLKLSMMKCVQLSWGPLLYEMSRIDENGLQQCDRYGQEN
jgi:hypothetical protein